MPGACHDGIRADMRFAEHRQVRMPQAVEVKAVYAQVADALALVAEARRLDELAVRLRADEVEAPPGRGIGLLQGNDLPDNAVLVILGGHEVVVGIILAVEKLVLRLLLAPTLEERQDHLLVEGERAKAALRLEVAIIVERVLPLHREALDLLGKHQGHLLEAAAFP